MLAFFATKIVLSLDFYATGLKTTVFMYICNVEKSTDIFDESVSLLSLLEIW